MKTTFYIFILCFILLVASQYCEECTRPHGKSSWPECLGKDVETCKAIIHKSVHAAVIQVIHYRDPVTMDYQFNRVRIILGYDDDLVHIIPQLG